jgi:hypothetical protein
MLTLDICQVHLYFFAEFYFIIVEPVDGLDLINRLVHV